MIFKETGLQGAFLIELEKNSDDRGFFARLFDKKVFEERGLDTDLGHSNISFNKKAGTLRGIHFQVAPMEETKLIRCTRGEIFDVIVDLRGGSPTYLQHFTERLCQDNRLAIYAPKGFGHGFITLKDNSEVFYQMSGCYSSEHARGIRWDDPALGINWPVKNPIISERDANAGIMTKSNKEG
jgi:dTDP-4-dehydrorhamnose 3,5-epimerase